MPRVKVKRMDGSTEYVEVEDRQHYEVTVELQTEDDDEWYVRYEIVQADGAAVAKATCPVEPRERAVEARKLTRGEVAVLVLNGMTIAGKDPR